MTEENMTEETTTEIQQSVLTLTELNPEGFEVVVDVVADGAGHIMERHVRATGFVLNPVSLRKDLVEYVEKLAVGEEVTEINL
jgi:hypothetical protein